MARCGVVSVRISRGVDFLDLEHRWRDLEGRSRGSFFQSWTWVGCLSGERFPDPVLVEATEAGCTVALGLLNRARHLLRPSTLYLGESGSPELDTPYVEQNGFLTEAGREEELTALCLRKLAAAHDVVLSGVGPQVVAATRRSAPLALTERRQASPFVDLAAIRRLGGDALAGRSANTRQQVRRSDRFYQRHGPLVVKPATSVTEARVMLGRMALLHQAAWQSRGQPGSFARPFFGRFHHALIASGWPRGEIALLEISAGPTPIGYLYNFIWHGRMLAYQSGFDYPDQPGPAKPGLTCHHQAIRLSLEQGLEVYDFLAGEDRYKQSLADQSHDQFWLTAGPFWSPWLRARQMARRLR